MHVLNVVEDVPHDPQAAPAAREVYLCDVAGHDDPGAEPEPGKEHLHLLGCGVLRLVQDDEGVVEGPTTHVGQRCHLDRAGLGQPRDRLGVDHVVQRVVQRPQVGVDLLVQRAGQVPQPLSGLDRRAGQDDPVDLLGLQRLDGLGHGEVRLTGARRADAEDDRVFVDRVDVPLLVQRLGPDGSATTGEDVQAEYVGRPLAMAAAQHRQAAVDDILGEWLALGQQGQQFPDEADRQRVVRRLSGDGDLVPAHEDIAVQALLDPAEQGISRPEQPDHRHGGRDDDLRGHGVRLGGVGHELCGPALSVTAVRLPDSTCGPASLPGSATLLPGFSRAATRGHDRRVHAGAHAARSDGRLCRC